ncbi:MAG: AAA family ATPase [Balneola sp.]
MTFNRHLNKQLQAWKDNPKRKPLLLRGARQVGKTTIIQTFAKNYTHAISLNLERAADLRFFQEYQDVSILLDALFLANNISSDEQSNTLLFIDEIQESPEAISLLRYFYEDLPELHVIAAGSLLEHAIRKVKSFPVGRVQYLYLHPLNFAEYLEATGNTSALEQLQKIPVPYFAHQTLKKLFHDYAIIGGMPEVVSSYIQNQNVADLPVFYESIWSAYKDDVEKYSRNSTDAKVIRHIMDTAHNYVDQRIKFQHFGNSNYRSREVGEAMKNLSDARIIQLIYPTTDQAPPLKADFKKSPRLQFLDTGLVNYELNIQADMLAMDDLNNTYKGAIIPHIITQELISLNTINYHKPNFWVREKSQSSSEVDLVIPHKEKAIPVEIKSGKTGTLKSLHQFIERSEHNYAVRVYAGKFSIEEHETAINKKPYILMNMPYYLGTQLHEYIHYFVENH